MKSGVARPAYCITLPPIAGPTAHPALRATLVIPLAYVYADGGTTAMTYDWRVGTSISTSASLARNNAAARDSVGAVGASMSSMLDGKCVNTIVLTRPMRRAIQAAARCDTTLSTRAAKNSHANCTSVMPYRSKNQY